MRESVGLDMYISYSYNTMRELSGDLKSHSLYYHDDTDMPL